MTTAGVRAPSGRLDLAAMQHLTGFLIAMVDAPARRVFQRTIGRPCELREVEFTLLVLLQANHGAAPKAAGAGAEPAGNPT